MFQLFCHLGNDPTLNPSNLSPKRGRVPRGRSLIFNAGSVFFFVPTGGVIARTSPSKKRPRFSSCVIRVLHSTRTPGQSYSKDTKAEEGDDRRPECSGVVVIFAGPSAASVVGGHSHVARLRSCRDSWRWRSTAVAAAV